jgi:hypothetical protein
VSELDVSLLVRRTRLLLRFYPPGYRAHRGEEILDTLLETTRPGRGWPPAREVASVIAGGLRARRAANLNQGLPVSLRHVGILAAAMIMVVWAPATLLGAVDQHMVDPSYGLRSGIELGLVLASLLAVAALAATWCGRRWLVAAAVAAAVLAAIACHRVVGGLWVNVMAEMSVPTVLALVVLLPLTKRAERPPVSLLRLPCLPLAVNFVAGLGIASGLLHIHNAFPIIPTLRTAVVLLAPYDTYLSLVPVLVAVCWLVTDVRPLAAVTLQFLLWRVFYAAMGYHYPAESWTQMAIVVGLPLALTGALVWLLRHRTRTAPPTIG